MWTTSVKEGNEKLVLNDQPRSFGMSFAKYVAIKSAPHASWRLRLKNGFVSSIQPIFAVAFSMKYSPLML